MSKKIGLLKKMILFNMNNERVIVRITKIYLQNWKNFSEAKIQLPERGFLIGPNASGKSNFLDSLRFLKDIARADGGLEKALNDRGGLKKIRSLSARKKTDVIINIELEETQKTKKNQWNYHLGIKQESRGSHKTIISEEIVKKNGKTIIKRPDKEDKKDKLRLTQTSLEQINANVKFRPVYTFFQEINYIHLIPQIIRRPELFFNTTIKIEDDSFGFHFMEKILNTTPRTREARLKKIEKALKIAVPNLSNLAEARDEKGIPHLEAIYEHWRPNAGKQKENQFSDGTIRLIGLLWSILESKPLLLLEEPELSLHPGIVRRLPNMLYKLIKSSRKNTQILISTHSPDLLSDGSIGADELILLKPQKEGTSVKVATEIQEIKTLMESGFHADEAVLPYSSPEKIEKLSSLD